MSNVKRDRFTPWVGFGVDALSNNYNVVKGYRKERINSMWICSFQILTLGESSRRQLSAPKNVHL